MSTPSLYLKQEISTKQLPSLSDKWLFVGLDMAPVDTLETGVAVIDRNKRLLRMEKLNDDEQIFTFIKNLGPKSSLIIALDVPKSLSIPGKWRQLEVKMHPLRLDRQDGSEPLDRYAPRAREFYDRLKAEGLLVFNYFTYHAKLRYDMTTPFRNRSPQGCRALQALIKERLALQEMPSNLAPSSVLDAMIGSYVAWSLYAGQDQEHFQLFLDEADRLYLDPLKLLEKKPARRRRFSSRR